MTNGKREGSANDIQNVLERVYGVHVSVKDLRGGDSTCGLNGGNANSSEINKSVSFYVRVSAFSYNTIKDFQRFRNILYNIISLTDHVQRNQLGLIQWDTSVEKPFLPKLSKLQQVIRKQFLASFERYETLFGALEPKALFTRAENFAII